MLRDKFKKSKSEFVSTRLRGKALKQAHLNYKNRNSSKLSRFKIHYEKI